MQSLCEVCRRQQGAGNVAFSMEFVPEGEPEGCEWRRRKRGSLHPLHMGVGVRSLLQKRQLIWLEDWAVGLLCGKSEQQSHPMYVWLVDSSLNKSLSIHRALYPSAVWQTIELSRPYLHIPENKTTCEHQGVVQSACDTGRAALKIKLSAKTSSRLPSAYPS
jgi:hypothetical protein